MNGTDGHLFGREPTALDEEGGFDPRAMTPDERTGVLDAGKAFTAGGDEPWLLISGRFTSGNGKPGTEQLVARKLYDVFGYPAAPPGRTLNVLLNSPGGSLDSAYSTTLYLSAYSSTLNVYVPDRAKSASTLLAVGADTVHLSVFGELGPLDTQIPDPRNPANTVSALDCYQSVDYVRAFGFKTVTLALPQLVDVTERRISVGELIDTATGFALGAISPVLQSVSALDFGGWGRSLRIGENYAKKLLQLKAKDGDRERTERIAYQLVYGYPHHLFPIDYHEAARIGLRVARMEPGRYGGAYGVVEACHGKDFVGFISAGEADKEKAAEDRRTETAPPDAGVRVAPNGQAAPDEHANADVGTARAWSGG